MQFDQPVNLVGFPASWHDGTPTNVDSASTLAADTINIHFPGLLYTAVSPLTVVAGDMAVTSVATGLPVAPGIFPF